MSLDNSNGAVKIEVTPEDAPFFFAVTAILSQQAAMMELMRALGQANELVLQKLQRDQMAMHVAAGAIHKHIELHKKHLQESQRMAENFFNLINQRATNKAVADGSIENQKTAT